MRIYWLQISGFYHRSYFTSADVKLPDRKKNRSSTKSRQHEAWSCRHWFCPILLLSARDKGDQCSLANVEPFFVPTLSSIVPFVHSESTLSFSPHESRSRLTRSEVKRCASVHFFFDSPRDWRSAIYFFISNHSLPDAFLGTITVRLQTE